MKRAITQTFVLGAVAMLGTAIVITSGTFSAQAAQAPAGRRGRGTHIIEQAPTDHAVAITKTKLDQYLKDMDAAHEETLRMIEGGRFNINIRRIKEPETRPLIHPHTIDLWYVIEGSGSLTTGGQFANGQDTGGVTQELKVGDTMFIPSNLPHWMSKVGPNGVTWLNIRWDDNWPAGATMGAGKAKPAAGAPPGRGMAPFEYAPTDHSIYIPKEKLDQDISDMEAKNTSTDRVIEGGHFNVNIRRTQKPSALIHPTTADLWIILKGSGTANTGFTMQDRKRVEGTGVNAPLKVGDLLFVPSNTTHGFGAVNGAVVWWNIRWDTDYQ